MMSKDERKKQKPIIRLKNSFKYAFIGIASSLKDGPNIIIGIICTVLTISCGIIFKVSNFEWLILIIMIFLVLASELLNTSLEAIIDLIKDEYHPLAKKAKDSAAAAVLLFIIASAIVATVIFIPKLIDLF